MHISITTLSELDYPSQNVLHNYKMDMHHVETT